MVRRLQRAASEPRSVFEADAEPHDPRLLSSNRLHQLPQTFDRDRSQGQNREKQASPPWRFPSSHEAGVDLRRSPTNTWTIEQRFALLVLRNCYHASWQETANIFNQVFSHELAKWGFFREGPGLHGITRGALGSQFSELRDTRHTCGYEAIEALRSITRLEELQPPFDATNHAILSTARALDISLSHPGAIVKSLLPVKNLSKSQPRTRRKRDGSAMSDTEASVIYESDGASVSPSKRPRVTPAKTSKLAQSINNVGNVRPGTHVSAASHYHGQHDSNYRSLPQD